MTTTWRDRLRYAVDEFFARGTVALIAGLFVVSALFVIVIAVVVAVARLDTDGRSLPELLWMGLLRTLDPGTMGSDTGRPEFLAAMLAVTLVAIFVLSALIGIINTGIQGRLSELRKGRSRVLESGHVVILGWSQQVFAILSELVAANANQPRSTIVVLADRDKVENKALNAVFADLFDAAGSEIYLRPAGEYIRPGREVNFATVVEAAARRDEVAIGYRLRAHSGDSSRAYGVRVNPRKSYNITFAEGDRVIVLAEG